MSQAQLFSNGRSRQTLARSGRGYGLSAPDDLLARANRIGMGDIVQNLLGKGSNEELVRTLIERIEGLQLKPVTNAPVTAKSLAARPVVRMFAEAPRSVTLPRARKVENWERALIEAAILVLPIPGSTTTIDALRLVADRYNVSIGIGPSAGVGFGLGLGVGAGVILAPGSQLGIYGSLDVRAGLIDSASIGLQLTIVKGDITAFNGIGMAVGAAVEAGVSVQAQILFDSSMTFQGVSFELGAGLGIEPIEVFLAAQASGSQALALARAANLIEGAPTEDTEPMALPTPPAPRAKGMALTEAGIAAATFVIERVITNEGDIHWNLDQMRGLKHPNDKAPANPAAFKDGRKIALDTWPFVENKLGDRIAAWFAVDWQYNGASLGNVRISNVGTNDALGWGLNVEARVMDDNIVYPQNDPRYAALRIRFEYHFSRTIGSDVIAYTELHLYGDGTFEQTGGWIQ